MGTWIEGWPFWYYGIFLNTAYKALYKGTRCRDLYTQFYKKTLILIVWGFRFFNLINKEKFKWLMMMVRFM